MNTLSKIVRLLAAFAAIIYVPYIGAWIFYEGRFPEHFYDFPELVAPEKAGYNRWVFLVIAIFCGIVAVFYLFPQVFGFKKIKTPARQDVPKRSLPVWFWVGLVMWAGTLAVLWSKSSEPKWLINWACLPLFWGFTLMLDGWVFVRSGGKSLAADRPKVLVGIGVASIFGWLIFEYLNFFVLDNWIYPKGDLIPDDEFVMYAVLGSSGLMPMAFEWYALFKTFDGLRTKYSAGPKITLPHWIQVGLALAVLVGLFFISHFPNTVFVLLWVAPLIVLAVALNWIGVWTPFSPLKNGNWTPLLLMSLTYFVQGFLCEFWNYFSGTHLPDGTVQTFNPDYWQYSLPYVNVYHVFEMPVLGLAGYIPFGVFCAVWWIAFAWMTDMPIAVFEEEEG